MRTEEELLAAFGSHREPFSQAAADGASSAEAYVAGLSDPHERAGLHLYGRRVLAELDLDVYLTTCRWGIDDLTAQSASAGDERSRAWWMSLANIVSYNLSADLADCWPGDDRPRTRRHHESGRDAAVDCIRWRSQLGRGPAALSIAWWAKGIHELALGEDEEALESWFRSVRESQSAAQFGDEEAEMTAILCRGYLALARWRTGDPRGVASYDQAIATLRHHPDTEDAGFCIDQLETTRRRHRIGSDG